MPAGVLPCHPPQGIHKLIRRGFCIWSNAVPQRGGVGGYPSQASCLPDCAEKGDGDQNGPCNMPLATKSPFLHPVLRAG